MNVSKSSEQGLRAWLLTDTPSSRRHAQLAAWYRGWLSFRANPMTMLGLGILLFLVFVAALAPVLSPHDPFDQDLAARLLPPGSENYILGSDGLGRDILSRVIYGARVSLSVGFTPASRAA